MKNYKVSVIIPNFNGEKLLQKNLPSFIKAWEYKKNNILEIIIVDDGSEDNGVNFVKKNYPNIKVIKHTKNRGFSASVNTGARASKGELLLLINNDVIPSENFLEATFTHFLDDSVFAVSLREKDYGYAKGKFEDGYILHSPGKADGKVHPTFWVSGGSGLYRRDIWMKLGGMDEKLLSPFYWEDIDLSYGALKRGYKLLWEPKAIVEHKHETTIGKFPKKMVQRIKERNQLLFNWKNLTSQRLIRIHIRSIISRAIKHPGYFRIILMALLKYKVMKEARAKEKKEAKVSDEAIFASYNTK